MKKSVIILGLGLMIGVANAQQYPVPPINYQCPVGYQRYGKWCVPKDQSALQQPVPANDHQCPPYYTHQGDWCTPNNTNQNHTFPYHR